MRANSNVDVTDLYPQPQNFIEVIVLGRRLCFIHVPLTFISRGLTDVFANKNNKSVQETLAHPRYKSLLETISRQYPAAMDEPLGAFLADLKSRGDVLYRRFLNAHGDKTYCQFRMGEGPAKRQKGLYLYALRDEVVYIGRSHDPFGKRVDQGYGKIHPKNCFVDGQSTNCHLNALIEAQAEDVTFFVCMMTENSEIDFFERAFIQERRPPWNVALAK